jgi:hypothetical protein
VVSVTDPYSRILGFLDRSRYFFSQVAPQLYLRGRVDPVVTSYIYIYIYYSSIRAKYFANLILVEVTILLILVEGHKI